MSWKSSGEPREGGDKSRQTRLLDQLPTSRIMKSEKLCNNYWKYNLETAQKPHQTQEIKLYLNIEQGCWGVQNNSQSRGSSAIIEQRIISPDFCLLNPTFEIFIAARVDSSLRPPCRGYFPPFPCSRWPDRNLIHFKGLILSRCDPSAITCLGGPDVLDSGTVRLLWAPSHLVPLHFPKAEFHFVLPSGDI